SMVLGASRPELALLVLFLCAPAVAQNTGQASVSTAGALGNGDSEVPWISADGRFVAFTSRASNPAPGDPDAIEDAFVRDLSTNTTELVSVDSNGVKGVGR